MSYPRGLDEYSEQEIRGEIRRRLHLRAEHKCDYCEQPVPSKRKCKFPERHKLMEGDHHFWKVGARVPDGYGDWKPEQNYRGNKR